MTVSGLTMTSADRQPDQSPDNPAQRRRSGMVNFGRFLVERPQHTDLMPQRQDLHLEGGARTED
jgi:hypothetical protein